MIGCLDTTTEEFAEGLGEAQLNLLLCVMQALQCSRQRRILAALAAFAACLFDIQRLLQCTNFRLPPQLTMTSLSVNVNSC